MTLTELLAMPDDALLTPGDVASLLKIDPKTVTRNCKAGKLSSIRTPGGHRRLFAGEIKALFAGRSS